MLIICCSESLWRMAFFTTAERMKGNWQKVNLMSSVTKTAHEFEASLVRNQTSRERGTGRKPKDINDKNSWTPCLIGYDVGELA